MSDFLESHYCVALSAIFKVVCSVIVKGNQGVECLCFFKTVNQLWQKNALTCFISKTLQLMEPPRRDQLFKVGRIRQYSKEERILCKIWFVVDTVLNVSQMLFYLIFIKSQIICPRSVTKVVPAGFKPRSMWFQSPYYTLSHRTEWLIAF